RDASRVVAPVLPGASRVERRKSNRVVVLATLHRSQGEHARRRRAPRGPYPADVSLVPGLARLVVRRLRSAGRAVLLPRRLLPGGRPGLGRSGAELSHGAGGALPAGGRRGRGSGRSAAS